MIEPAHTETHRVYCVNTDIQREGKARLQQKRDNIQFNAMVACKVRIIGELSLSKRFAQQLNVTNSLTSSVTHYTAITA